MGVGSGLSAPSPWICPCFDTQSQLTAFLYIAHYFPEPFLTIFQENFRIHRETVFIQKELVCRFCRAHRGLPVDFFAPVVQFYLLLSPYLCFISFLYLDLYVLGDDKLGVFYANKTSMCLDPHLN